MREDITSIPVSEVFEPRDGCPFAVCAIFWKNAYWNISPAQL